MRKVAQKSNGGKSEAFMPADHGMDRASMWDVVSVDEAVDGEDAIKREEGTHGAYCEPPLQTWALI